MKKGSKKISSTWSYFNRLGDKSALCKLCGKFVKTSGNTTNARYHLKIKHKLIVQEQKDDQSEASDVIVLCPETTKEQDGIKEQQSQENDLKVPKNDEDFEEKPSKKRRKLKQNELKNKGDPLQIGSPKGQEDAVTEFLVFQKPKQRQHKKNAKVSADAPKRPKRSIVWKFFEKKPNSKYAQCRIKGCQMEIACSTNTTNCLDHLKRHHKRALDFDAVVSSTWAYYDKIDDKTASCQLCGKIVKTSGNTTNARNHLKAKHKILIETKSRGVKQEDYINVLEDHQYENLKDEIQIEVQDPSSAIAGIEEHSDHPEEPEEVYCMEVLEDEMVALEDSHSFEGKKAKKRPSNSHSSSFQPKKPNMQQDHHNDSRGHFDFSHPVDIFFASMAATVKSMPPEKIVAIKQKISGIVFEEELQQLRNENIQYIYE
uniref:BED-type domain-containing protein n=2 Tax=Lutzomyia longipalpis TaxID=7200 RepID=A0A1B0CS90_LUTLO